MQENIVKKLTNHRPTVTRQRIACRRPLINASRNPTSHQELEEIESSSH
jgi:hypothetical protein